MNERLAVATEREIFCLFPHPTAFYTLSTHRKWLLRRRRRRHRTQRKCFNRTHLHARVSHASDLRISSDGFRADSIWIFNSSFVKLLFTLKPRPKKLLS